MSFKKTIHIVAALSIISGTAVLNIIKTKEASNAYASEVKTKGLVVKGAFARASLGNMKNSAAFMSLLNHTDKADKLIGVQSDIAKRIELHTHIKEGDVMKMRKIEAIDVPAEGFADLEPGGHHVMLIGLHKPLKAGDKFSLTLTFATAGDIKTDVVVKALGSESHDAHHRGSHRGSHSGATEEAPKHEEHHRGSNSGAAPTSPRGSH